MYDFDTIGELINLAKANQISIAEVVIRREVELSTDSSNEIKQKMQSALTVMKDAIKKGLEEELSSISCYEGSNAQLMDKAANEGETITGSLMPQAIANALAVSEVNASMGKIVAVPTAGSCGILPGALLTIAIERGVDDDKIIEALFVASGIGLVVAKQASVSGAEGGCQAECGTATGMAAGAITYLVNGSPQQISNAVAIALKNILGLVCDPVAGLVEVPCIKRNAMGASNALTAAEMALAGIESLIPADEVILAMKEVGESLPEKLRETSLGGLAATPTGCKIKEEFLNKN
ncbi:L-serine ammonia-lyase, iron-sulfur-dependent, subunit alpha [Selenihalanaerobacter shriftii]|uniref:L-serine dehydratase n=1 Tax=Selenihalanaerobacter shriftii TaxID=142842 RepID=A0A1T4QRG0_9FIRM|nr:L-serine ammonia-lyase, iron-sulfur-dependent, subunit alpha [Selenihalanaerobacter shriftii]SKA06285.1 L-serine dehydratase [Selenihalanaerobacter shriftii]